MRIVLVGLAYLACFGLWMAVFAIAKGLLGSRTEPGDSVVSVRGSSAVMAGASALGGILGGVAAVIISPRSTVITCFVMWAVINLAAPVLLGSQRVPGKEDCPPLPLSASWVATRLLIPFTVGYAVAAVVTYQMYTWG